MANVTTGPDLYREQLSSGRTEALFGGLSAAGLLLFARRMSRNGIGGWAIAFFLMFAMFFFYTLNYRTLKIRLNEDALRLKFGIFEWAIPVSNIASCAPDYVPLQRIGGAGIHFTSIDGRYRAMFNFLEYPRLVVGLKQKQGPVRDVVFSTQRPDALMSLIRNRID